MTGIVVDESWLTELQGRLDGFARSQVPFAAAQALNDTAFQAREAAQREMERALDRPTPFTLRGVAVKKARKSAPVATVYVKRIQAAYLRFQTEGGTRRSRSGGTLPAPAKQRKNRYGNLPRRKIQTLLAKPNVFRREIYGVDGIWQRMKSGRLKLLIVLKQSFRYRKRYDFEGTVETAARKGFRRNFTKQLRQAIQTSRGRAVAKAVSR